MHVSHSSYVQNSPSEPSGTNTKNIIEICSAGEWFPSADPRGKSNLTHCVSDVWATWSCTCVPAHPSWIGFLPLRLQHSSCGLLSLSAGCGCALCGIQGLAGVFSFWNVCNMMWSIGCSIPETGSHPLPGAAWVEQKTLNTTLGYCLCLYLYLFIFLSVCSFCVRPSPGQTLNWRTVELPSSFSALNRAFMGKNPAEEELEM